MSNFALNQLRPFGDLYEPHYNNSYTGMNWETPTYGQSWNQQPQEQQSWNPNQQSWQGSEVHSTWSNSYGNSYDQSNQGWQNQPPTQQNEQGWQFQNQGTWHNQWQEPESHLSWNQAQASQFGNQHSNGYWQEQNAWQGYEANQPWNNQTNSNQNWNNYSEFASNEVEGVQPGFVQETQVQPDLRSEAEKETSLQPLEVMSDEGNHDSCEDSESSKTIQEACEQPETEQPVIQQLDPSEFQLPRDYKANNSDVDDEEIEEVYSDPLPPKWSQQPLEESTKPEQLSLTYEKHRPTEVIFGYRGVSSELEPFKQAELTFKSEDIPQYPKITLMYRLKASEPNEAPEKQTVNEKLVRGMKDDVKQEESPRPSPTFQAEPKRFNLNQEVFDWLQMLKKEADAVKPMVIYGNQEKLTDSRAFDPISDDTLLQPEFQLSSISPDHEANQQETIKATKQQIDNSDAKLKEEAEEKGDPLFNLIELPKSLFFPFRPDKGNAETQELGEAEFKQKSSLVEVDNNCDLMAQQADMGQDEANANLEQAETEIAQAGSHNAEHELAVDTPEPKLEFKESNYGSELSSRAGNDEEAEFEQAKEPKPKTELGMAAKLSLDAEKKNAESECEAKQEQKLSWNLDEQDLEILDQIAEIVEDLYVDIQAEELMTMYPEEYPQIPEFEKLKKTLPTHTEIANLSPTVVELQEHNFEQLHEEKEPPIAGLNIELSKEQMLQIEAALEGLVQNLVAALSRLWVDECTNHVVNGTRPKELYFQHKRRFLHDYNNAAAKLRLEVQGYPETQQVHHLIFK